MQREDVERVWPERLKIRDTGLHDDLGGPGQRIYTTAGRGYERVEYVRADLYAALQAELEALIHDIERAKEQHMHLLAERDALQGQLNDLRNGWANSVKAHAALLAERDAAFAAGQEDMRERAADAVWGVGVTGNTTHSDMEDAIRALTIKDRP